jgi:DUF4097 and DUF4098 domain-containing protein YvlB
MQRKWLIASFLVLAELLVLGGIILSSRSGLSWRSVLGLGLGPSNAFSAQADEDQAFTISGPAELDIASLAGNVTVTGGAGSQVEVHAHKTGWGADQAGAEAALAALKVVMTQSGDSITIKVEQPDDFQWGDLHGGSVDFTIEVPTATSVRAHTRFGTVELTATTGAVDLTSSSGDVTARNVDGSVELRSDFGAVTLEQATATTVDARTSSGRASLTDVAATGAVVVDTDFGSVSYIGGRAASLEARTDSGSVTLTGLTIDGAVSAHSDFGRVTLAQVDAGGGYDVGSSSGNVTVDGASGQVTARTDFGSVSVLHAVAATVSLHSSSGAVSFSGSLGAGPHSLDTDFGDVRLSLPPDTAANVDLSTSFGGIRSALPITLGPTGEVDESHWVGVLNGGGPQLTAETSSGSITLDILKA